MPSLENPRNSSHIHELFKIFCPFSPIHTIYLRVLILYHRVPHTWPGQYMYVSGSISQLHRLSSTLFSSPYRILAPGASQVNSFKHRWISVSLAFVCKIWNVLWDTFDQNQIENSAHHKSLLDAIVSPSSYPCRGGPAPIFCTCLDESTLT